MPSNETNIEDGFTESHDQIDSMLKSVLYSLQDALLISLGCVVRSNNKGLVFYEKQLYIKKKQK